MIASLKFVRLFIIVAACLFLGSCKKSTTDWSINYEYNATEPLGLKLFYNSLEYTFPKATIHYYKSHVPFQKILEERNFKYEKPLYMVVANSFHPNEEEWHNILGSIFQGNNVWISANEFSNLISNDILLHSEYNHTPKNDSIGDKFEVVMNNVCHRIITNQNNNEIFKGILPFSSFNNFIFKNAIDTVENLLTIRKITELEAACDSNLISYIAIQIGYGKLYLHHNPSLLTNYFLLQNNNFNYINAVLSTIDEDIDVVEFQSYLYADKTEGGLSNLLKYPALRIAFWIIIITALMYLITEIKRKQRIIPVINKDEDNTASFVKTVGQLYYNFGDNKNIALKMGQFYLEQIRSKYNIQTQQLDQAFVEKLHNKTGKDQAFIVEFTKMYQTIQNLDKIDDQTLHQYHKIIEQLNS